MQNANARARPDLKVLQPGAAPAIDPQTRSALVENITREMAWLWMATTVSDPQQQQDCLQRVLALNPQNTVAQQALAALTSGPPGFGVGSKGATGGGITTLHLPPGQINVPGILRVLRNDLTADQLLAQSRSTTTAHDASGSVDQFTNIVQEPRDPDYVPTSSTAAHAVSPFQAAGATNFPQWGMGAPASPSAPTKPPARRWPTWNWKLPIHHRALLIAALALVGVLLLVLVLERLFLAGDLPVVAPKEATRTSAVYPTPLALDVNATTVSTTRGTILVPGTAYADGRLGTNPPSTLKVVWLWENAFDGGNRRCSLPHATSVLVLETKLSPDGQRSFRIQNRDCSGWVSADMLSPNANPSEGVIVNNESWTPAK